MKNNGSTNTPLYPTLNKKEREIMLFIEDRTNWRPPTHQRCANALGLKDAKSVRQYLSQIEAKGYKTVFNNLK